MDPVTNQYAPGTGNPPADFGTDLATLQTNYSSVTTLAAQADAATGGDAGKRFIEAWKRARIIVDSGGGHTPTSTPTPTPAASKP